MDLMELARKEFLPFAKEILGKEFAFRDPGLELDVPPNLYRVLE